MTIKSEVSKKQFSLLMIKELIFTKLYNPILFILFLEFWQVTYGIAKYGNLRKNIPVFLVLAGIFLIVLVELIYSWRRYVKNYIVNEKSTINISEKSIEIESNGLNDFLDLSSISKIRENRKWFFIYFPSKCIIPLLKESILPQDMGTLRGILGNYKKSRRLPLRSVVVLLWVFVSFAGIFSICKSAVAFNGKLSWYIHSLQYDRTVKLENANIYETGLDDILDMAKKKQDIMPYLMADNFTIEFSPDGTIEKLDTYIYGYDEDKTLKNGYLLYYDKSKSDELTVHLQDMQGAENKFRNYQPDNDIQYLIQMIKIIPLQKEVSQWQSDAYGLLYKGYFSWGYNTEGIRFIDNQGKITIPTVAMEEIVGPSLSLYCVGETDTIIPKRFVFKGTIPMEENQGGE